MKKIRFKLNSILITQWVVLISLIGCQSQEVDNWDKVAEIQSNISAPVFPDQEFNILNFGAMGNGNFDCTEAISQAILLCHNSGGGRVIIPPGDYLTGPIHLKSNVNLNIQKDATLLFSTDYDAYLPVVLTRFEGVECMNYSPLIYAYEAENIAISGSGTVNGQASNSIWWPWAGKAEYGWNSSITSQFDDRDSLFQMGEAKIPVEKRIFGKNHYLRPNFIQFYKCRSILIDSITVINSPMWEIHPVLSENIIVQNIVIKSHGPNNDGCNPESSKNILIQNCYFDTGDDCIAIKSGRNGDGRRINVPSENIIVRNCTMKDGHGGVVIGSETSGGVRNVYVENCTMDSPHLERALRIKTNSLRGGIIENIFMRKVTVGEVSDAILRINFNYENGDAGAHTPIVRNVSMSEVTSQKSLYVLALDGYERSPITNINITDCNFEGVREKNIVNHVKDLKLKNISINGKSLEK